MDKVMMLALYEVSERIKYWEHQIRTFKPYFKESEEKSNKRLDELILLVEELHKVYDIILDNKT
jgi:hypothetical protein